MLTALEEGVKGNVWSRLIDKVWSERNLHASFHKVAANGGAPGTDHVTVEEFERHLQANVAKLTATLHEGSYEPQAIRRTYIPKPGSNEQRPLGIPTVRDRVVQGAVRHVVEPIFEKEFAAHSYGFRPGRGCKDALRRADQLLKQGFVYVADADLKSYFDTIPHDRLMARLRERIADGRVLGLIESYLKAGIMDGLEEWEPEAGAPQGAVLSPLLSNIYLNPLDHLMAAQGWEMVRYADDFVILCRSQAEAEAALTQVRQWCEAEGLLLHPTKTKIVDVREEGFDYLGYRFQTTRQGRLTRWPRKKSLDKLRASLRMKTRRNDGRSLRCIVEDVNRTLRGWFGYFKHSCRATFTPVDKWIRGRLRSILRRRAGRRGRGRGRGSDHQRWPNAYFAERGYSCLAAAHDAARQPPWG
ncbi:MAG: group II intron reverse transcriptase/maturase [Gemmataceae bacterium]|nr:group II intron reverse transcriptase/maturase [Gemmataceae bacterium]